MKPETSKWVHGLVGGVITSISTTGLALLGSKVIGIELDIKTFALACITSGVVGALAYLKQSPLPPE